MSTENINLVPFEDGKDINDIPFPLEELPPMLKETAESVAYAYNSPVEIVASSILSILGFCLGRGVSIQTYHPEPTYGLTYSYIGASPGVGKGAIKPLLAPINSFVADYKKRLRIDVEGELRAELEGKKREPTQKDINEKLGRGYATLHTSMFTEEGLAQLLMNNGEYVVLHSTEAAGVVHAILGQGRQKMPLNNLLKHCYAGDYYSETYKSSEEANLLNPRMGILLLSTPSTLNEFVANPMIQQDGTLSRFLIYRHKGKRTELPNQTRILDEQVTKQWEQVTQGLLRRYWRRSKDEAEIKVSKGATDVHLEFYNRLVRESEELSDKIEETGITTRVAENAGRLAIVLHFGRHCERGEDMELDERTMKDAVKLAEFYYRQSLEVLDSVSTQDPREDKVINGLLEYLDRKSCPISLRELDKEGFLSIPDRKLINPLIQEGILVAWNNSEGNKPSPTIALANQPYIPDDLEFLKMVK